MSSLPLTEASVRTRVVSWNEAAEIKLLVCNDAFVIPSRTGCAVRWRRPSASNALLVSRIPRDQLVRPPGKCYPPHLQLRPFAAFDARSLRYAYRQSLHPATDTHLEFL